MLTDVGPSGVQSSPGRMAWHVLTEQDMRPWSCHTCMCWNVAIPFHSKLSLTEEPLQDVGSHVRHSAGLGELQQPG